MLFGEDATYDWISERIRAGWELETTSIPADAGALELEDPDRIPLVGITQEGRFEPFSADRRPPVEPGDRLIQLRAPETPRVPEPEAASA